jgi:hypothetical protein
MTYKDVLEEQWPFLEAMAKWVPGGSGWAPCGLHFDCPNCVLDSEQDCSALSRRLVTERGITSYAD